MQHSDQWERSSHGITDVYRHPINVWSATLFRTLTTLQLYALNLPGRIMKIEFFLHMVFNTLYDESMNILNHIKL